MKRYIPGLLLTSIPCTFLLCVFSMAFRAQAQQTIKPMPYGRVNGISLSSFAPAELENSFNLLRERKFDEALTALQEEATKHPTDLAAYVGSMQAKPEEWTNEIRQLKELIASNKSSDNKEVADAYFKLGTLLFYRWGARIKVAGVAANKDNGVEIERAAELLYRSWTINHSAISGMMLQELVPYLPYKSGFKQKHFSEVRNISDQLLQSLAGAEAYSLYLEAKKAQWNATPPAVQLIPTRNLRSLRGILKRLWIESSTRRGHQIKKGGQLYIEPKPYTAEQKRQRAYFESWINAITKES